MSSHLSWLNRYEVLGFGAATGRDEVFRALVLARIIEPTSKLDSLRVLEEAGMDSPSYRTVQRRLRLYADAEDAAGEDAAGGALTAGMPGNQRLSMLLVAGGGRGWRGRVRTTSVSVQRRCCSTT